MSRSRALHRWVPCSGSGFPSPRQRKPPAMSAQLMKRRHRLVLKSARRSRDESRVFILCRRGQISVREGTLNCLTLSSVHAFRLFLLYVIAVVCCNSVAAQQSSSDASGKTLAQSVQELREQVQELRAAVAEMKSEASEYRAQSEELRKELEELRGSAPAPAAESAPAPAQSSGAPASTDQRVSNLEENAQLLASEIRTEYQTKVESASKYRVRLSGLVLMNLFRNSGFVDNQ